MRFLRILPIVIIKEERDDDRSGRCASSAGAGAGDVPGTFQGGNAAAGRPTAGSWGVLRRAMGSAVASAASPVPADIRVYARMSR
jgi:hypothetical protein